MASLSAYAYNQCVMSERILLIVLTLAATGAASAECPVDDFDDRNDDGWIHCGEWSEDQSPMWDPSSGSYCLGLNEPLRHSPPPPLSIAAEWTQAGEDPRYANGCMRVGFTAGTEAAGTWRTHYVLSLRADCKNGGYKAMLGPSLSRLSIFRQFELIADDPSVEFVQGQSYRAQFCAVGSDLSLKVWPIADDEPATPQLTASNELYVRGNLGVGVFIENDNRGPNIRGCFDDIRFVPIPRCPGDLDCSGRVDLDDLRAVYAEWGSYTPCAPRRPQDINGDCTIGLADALSVAKSWGHCPAAQAP